MWNNRGQAMLEFAVMASIGLMALAVLIQIGLRMNYQQEIDQQTFRRALRTAANFDTANNRPPQAVTYIHIRDRQIPDPSDGFGMMPRVTTEATSTAVLGKFLTFLARDKDSHPRVVVNLNNKVQEFNSDDLTGQGSLISKVDRTINSTGSIQTTKANTTLRTNTTDNTTMTLNTKGQDAISSSLTSSTAFDW